jgi:hypothetical protein
LKRSIEYSTRTRNLALGWTIAISIFAGLLMAVVLSPLYVDVVSRSLLARLSVSLALMASTWVVGSVAYRVLVNVFSGREAQHGDRLRR